MALFAWTQPGRGRPQALHVLRVLVQNSGRHVNYEQMIHEAWNGTLVSKHTVAVTVGEVKKILGEFGPWISYRPRMGYYFEAFNADDLVRQGWHCLSERPRAATIRGCLKEPPCAT